MRFWRASKTAGLWGLILYVLILCAAPLSGCSGSTNPAPAVSETKLYLVRHAEKQKGDNPSLTDAGAHRALALAKIMGRFEIEAVYSSDYNRTLETAKPTANAYGFDIRLYDPRDLEGLASALRAAGESALVVGHSNTTPQLAAALGGEPGAPIDDAAEFDRLYVITLSSDETVKTAIRQYP